MNTSLNDTATCLVSALTCASAASTYTEAAQVYAAAGMGVFPCQPDSKLPATPHGFHDATTDPTVIDFWWTACPTAPVAVATGWPGPDVLDVDVRDDGDGMTALQRLREAGLLAGAVGLVRTPSGGVHVWFVGTDQRCGRLTGHHLDFKASGGYVLAAPSAVTAGRYALSGARAPRLARRLDWTAVRALLDPAPKLPASTTGSTPSGDVKGLAAWVASQPEGNRNSALFWACCRAVESGATDLDALVDAAVAAGLDRRAARATAQSALTTAGVS